MILLMHVPSFEAYRREIDDGGARAARAVYPDGVETFVNLMVERLLDRIQQAQLDWCAPTQ